MAMRLLSFDVLVWLNALLLGYLSWNGSFFAYHPAALSVGYLALMPSALYHECTFKEHWFHMNSQLISLVFSDAGWWVIYSNKDWLGKAHLTSKHAYVGFAALLLTNVTCVAALFGGMFPSSDARSIQKRKQARTLHVWTGRLNFTLGLAAAYSGFFKLKYVGPSHLICQVWFGFSFALLWALSLGFLKSKLFSKVLIKWR